MSREDTYPSDCSDAKWELIAPLVPEPRCWTPAGARLILYPRRDIVDGILYLVRTRCSWRQLPADLPAWESGYAYFAAREKDGTLDKLHDALRGKARAAEQREASPSAGIVDAQAVEGATPSRR